MASSEGSKISLRRKWFEKEDPAIMGGMGGGRAVKETAWATKGAEEMAISERTRCPCPRSRDEEQVFAEGFPFIV